MAAYLLIFACLIPSWSAQAKELSSDEAPKVRKNRIEIKAKRTDPVTIRPAAATVISPSTSLELTQSAGKVFVTLKSTDRSLQFNTKLPFVIQLMAEGPLQLEPAILANDNWPKTGLVAAVSYKGGTKGAVQVIQGSASVHVCDSKGSHCRKVRLSRALRFKI